MKTKINYFIKKVTKLQVKFRDVNRKTAGRILAISEIFDDCKNEMMKDAMSKKASKKLKALAPKLNLLSPEVKLQFIKLYLYR